MNIEKQTLNETNDNITTPVTLVDIGSGYVMKDLKDEKGNTIVTPVKVVGETLDSKPIFIGYDNDKIDVTIQDTKTNEELIELFGIVASQDVTFTIDQGAVSYGTVGSYPVIVQEDKTDVYFELTVNIVELINLNKDDLEEYAIETLEEDVTTDFPLVSNLSNVTVDNTSGITPTTTVIDATSTGDDALLFTQYGAGIRYEWIGKDPTAIKNVVAEFINVVQFSNGEYMKMKIEGIDYLIYSDNPLYQKWGFEVYDSGMLTLIQRGFVYLKVKCTWYRQINDKLKGMDAVLRFDDVHARKVIYKPISETSDFLVNNPTKLLADLVRDRNEVPYIAISKFDYDFADEGSAEIKTAIRKHSSPELIFGYGKYETGSRNTDYSNVSYKHERLPLTFHLRDDGLVAGTKYQEREAPLGAIRPLPVDGIPNVGDEIALFRADTLDGEYLYRLVWSVVLNEGVGSDLGLYGYITIGGVVTYEGKFSTTTDENIVISGHTWNRFKASPSGSDITRDIRVYLYKLGDSTATIEGGGISIE